MMHNYNRLLFAMVTALLFTFAQQSNAASSSSSRYVEYGDWLVACDNVGDCKAIGFDENEVSLAMHIHRNAGPNGRISISIVGEGSQPLDQFVIDGKKVALPAQSWSSSKEDGYIITTKKNDAALKFIASIHNAQRIGFFNSNTAENSLSLKGLSASLLLIDEIQGRLQTQQAFIRKGNKTETSVPPPHPLPNIVASTFRGKVLAEDQAKKIIDAIRKQQAPLFTKETCDNLEKDDSFDKVSLLSKTEVLAIIECSRSAYQSYFLAFRAPLNDPKKSNLLSPFGMRDENPLAGLSNAEYDPATVTLSSHSKGRGLFDCGDETLWVFDGKKFQLSEYSRQTRCGGMKSPGDFPMLWRSKTK